MPTHLIIPFLRFVLLHTANKISISIELQAERITISFLAVDVHWETNENKYLHKKRCKIAFECCLCDNSGDIAVLFLLAF